MSLPLQGSNPTGFTPSRLVVLIFTVVAGVLLTLGMLGSCSGPSARSAFAEGLP